MAFLDVLADQINNTFTIGENTTHTLDAVIDGQNVKYGSLGNLTKRIDQSAERRYVEEGFLRKDPYNTDPKQFEILMQEPSATILIKKRMFSSVNENYRPDYMDADEKMYYKAMKILFQNKCNQIATLEKLSKIQKIVSAIGNLPQQLMSVIISLTDDAGSGFSTGGFNLFGGINSNGSISNFTKVVDRVRRLYAFTNTSQSTNWITDPTNLFQSQFGQGTGTIEITNFTNFNTNVSVDSIKTAGSFGVTITDPYQAMLITEYDIEKALSDATNSFYNHKIFQFGQDSIEQVINDATVRLNQLRKNRGASGINFKISPDTLLGKRVRAILERNGSEIQFVYNTGLLGINSNVKVAPEYLQGGAVAGFDGLATQAIGSLGPDSNIRALNPESELTVFSRLVTAIFSKLQLEANSRNAFQTSNQNTNYARRKLRFQFVGHLIVQPMDIVHIYANSKSRYDTKLLSGLQNMFSGSGILQNLNKTIIDFRNATSLFSLGSNAQIQAEKAAFVGADFPNFLWSLIRPQFVNEIEGTHIFAGVVEGATDNWSDGKFMIDIRGRDNTIYFEMGKVNFKPGVDVFNGALFDPLTPFKTRFDTISSNAKSETPELLDENKYLLGVSQDTDTPLLKFKLGPNAGLPAHTDNVLQDRSIDRVTGAAGKIFYAPDGLVYKWKEGIGTLVQFGSSLDLNDPNKVGNPAITKEPFAGQDVMNVLSLLITGQPYNFTTYWKAVANFDGPAKDPQSNQDAAYSFYSSLQTDLKKNNITWGNFIPFKTLSMDDQSFAKVMQGQFQAVRRNQDLDAKIQELAEVTRQINTFGAAVVINPSNSTQFRQDKISAENKKKQLTEQINAIIAGMQKDAQSNHNAIGSIGDASFLSNPFSAGTNPSKDLSDAAQRRLLRRQINFLTRRMSYNVRGNEDKNLFIVDDYYDKDYDILAYEQSLDSNGIKLYNNEFGSVRDKIILTADLLNLEVFADTQGHIRVRPPQYNRMPSSVFYRMMYLKKALNVQVFPQFIDDIFQDQINTLIQRVEIVENQIRLDCAVLGINTDDACVSFILGDNGVNNSGDSFAFISNEGSAPSYSFRITDTSALLDAANPDSQNQLAVDLATQANGSKDIFSNTRKYQVVIDALTTNKLNQSGLGIQNIPSLSSNTRLDALIQILKTDTGQQISKDNFIVSSNIIDNGVNIPAGKSIDVFKVVSELSDKISERQKILKLLFGAIKNSTEIKSLDQDPSITNQLLGGAGNYGNVHTPEIFEHMIEDEGYDDYGVGSGTRYIIKRAQIRSINITVTPPDFTYIEVRGVLNPFAPNALPNGLTSFPQGGNGLVTAAAVDYDMWRNYGFRQQAPINVPFLNDPNTQCAPYANMILSRARKNIIRGTVTISGNEFMQPGEVVFIEDRQMLFYVHSVRHLFTQGSGFTTTLELTYGHSAGDYIPTTLDVIGKLLYNNRDISNFAVQRQSSSTNSSNLGILIRSPDSSLVFNTGNQEDPITSYSVSNTQTINNILYQAAYLVNANNVRGNNIKASVELRIYFDSNNALNDDLNEFAGSVQSILTSQGSGPKQIFNTNTSSNNGGGSTNPVLPNDAVSIIAIQLDDINDTNSPSQKAFDAARNLINQNTNTDSIISFNSSSGQKDKVRDNLFKYIVDCYISFSQVPSNVSQTAGI